MLAKVALNVQLKILPPPLSPVRVNTPIILRGRTLKILDVDLNYTGQKCLQHLVLIFSISLPMIIPVFVNVLENGRAFS